MKMIKQIIINDIKDVMGHLPSNAAYKSAIDYLNEVVNPKTNLTDISLILLNWRDDYLIKCDECGDYFLPEELEEKELPWNCFSTIRVCSDGCFNDYCQFKEPEKPEISIHI